MADSGPVGASGADSSTNVTPNQSKDVTAELDTEEVQRPNVGKKIPDEPTQEEWDDHMIDHTPYRGW